MTRFETRPKLDQQIIGIEKASRDRKSRRVCAPKPIYDGLPNHLQEGRIVGYALALDTFPRIDYTLPVMDSYE